MKRLIQLSIPLFAAYLALTGNLTLPNLIAGALVSLGVSVLLPKEELPYFSLRHVFKFIGTSILYLKTLAIEVIRGAILTARIVLSRNMPLKTGIIAIPSGTENELSTALSAHAITLSPGEMVVEIGTDGVMYTHCLNVDDSAQFFEKAQKMRVKYLGKMFENK